MDLDSLRARWTEELRQSHGDGWVERHAALLDWQWRYLVDCHFVDD
jgi:hypothetical protein